MAENIPNTPAGAVPPKPAEAAKVQPKKETVRINLPPKPTASPTIKIPTPAAVSVAPPASGATAVAVTQTAAAPAASAPVASAPAAVQRPTMGTASRPAPAPRPAAAATVSGLDVGLAFTALVVVLLALGSLFTL